MTKYLSDILIVIGAVAITASAGFISPILAGFIAGFFCLAIGIVLAVFRWTRERAKGTES